MKHIITKIEAQKNKKERVNVYINEDYSFSCSMELVYRYNLEKGADIDLDYIKEVVKEDNYIYCKESALKAIERTLKTEKEVIGKLEKKGFDKSAIDRVMIFLREYDFVDDDKYVKCYMKEKLKVDGKKKIKFNLLKKGINESSINRGFEFYDEDKNEYINSLKKIAEKKYISLKKQNLELVKLKKKLYDYLLRKGYSWSEIKLVSNELFNSSDFE
ncbi:MULTISPECIES: recombination regulator RecX [Clostridium]|uniref:recombination regulator RecX n=1 Tax=Clostridium TaxID=1485 RepID=UPI00069F4832|nr:MULTISPECIES: recombination regulator RecX [Clostridium]KOF57565.1 recombinase RecX [Clostridium sp. DMHC 10]MCD2345438.1 recombination regulator RecX [Clostridium guangxiense]